MTPPVDEPRTENQTLAGETPAPPGEDALVVLRRIERALDEIRGRLEATARTHQHQEFSLPRLLGGVCQVLAVGVVCVGLADWLYQGTYVRLLVELVLAGVLQVGALTGYTLARDGRT